MTTLFRMAVTLTLMAIAVRLMGTVDMWIAGRLGVVELSGVAYGAFMLDSFSIGLMGLFQAVAIRAASSIGAGSPALLSRVVTSSVKISAGLSLVMGILAVFAEPFLQVLSVSGPVADVSVEYMRIRLAGYIIRTIMLSYSYALISGGRAIHSVAGIFGGGLANVPLSLLLAFGVGEFDGLGVRGIAIGSVLGDIVSLLVVSFYLARLKADLKTASSPMDDAERNNRVGGVRDLLGLGLPIVGGKMCEEVTWVVGTSWLAATSLVGTAAHGVVFNLHVLGLAAVFGLQTSFSVNVATLIGARKPEQVAGLVAKGLAATVVYTLVVGIVFVVGRTWLAQLFTDDAAALDLIPTVLLLCAGFQFANYSAWTVEGILRGFSDVKFTMYLRILLLWAVFLPICAWQLLIEDNGVIGLWTALILFYTPLVVILVARLRIVMKREGCRARAQ